jgi:methyltransferase (TIGR00027 family)
VVDYAANVSRELSNGDTPSDIRVQIAMAALIGQACHQTVDKPLIFCDPLALRLIGLTPQTLATFVGDDLGYRTGRFYVAARNRFVTESIMAAADSGTTQLVVVDAGLSTFNYDDSRLRIFEIDRPETQEWKRHRLADAGIAIPPSMHYIPRTATTEWTARLEPAGFDPREPTTFVWLNTVALTSPENLYAVMQYTATCPTADLILDYADPSPSPISVGLESLGLTSLVLRPAAEVCADLRRTGFESINELSCPELINRYIHPPENRPTPIPLHLVHASHRATAPE